MFQGGGCFQSVPAEESEEESEEPDERDEPEVVVLDPRRRRLISNQTEKEDESTLFDSLAETDVS